MSRLPRSKIDPCDTISGIGHGSDWLNDQSCSSEMRSSWPTNVSGTNSGRSEPSLGSNIGTKENNSDDESHSRSGSMYVGDLNADAACFYRGKGEHRYRGMRAEWEVDDF